MRLNECDMESIIDLLRTFTYETDVEGETVTVNVELFPHSKTHQVTLFFNQKKGTLVADTIMEQYKKGEVSATDIADYVKMVCVQRWKHFLEMWKVNYNPIWNVDGVETRTVKTEFGKIVEHKKDSKVTDEQKENGTDNLTHGLKVTDEQKVNGTDNLTHGLKTVDEQKTDGKDNITHGLATTITEPTDTHKVAAFDSQVPVTYTEDSGTSHSNTNSGTDERAISMGKIEHENSGTDQRTINMGKVEHENSGTDQRTVSMGKIEHASSGTDTDTDDGEENVTDTLERHGNIGVTMTQQLLTAEDTFWSQYKFFDRWYDDIAEELALPIYE